MFDSEQISQQIADEESQDEPETTKTNNDDENLELDVQEDDLEGIL